MRSYIVYDGRAPIMGTDEAAVLEFLGDFESDESALAAFKKEYTDTDAALYSYVLNDNDELINEQHVGSGT